MKLTQHYLDCLSQASYVIGDEGTGRAVVVDPRRDIDVYVDDAAAAGMTIELIIETHFHADFLSGHLELADATGAEIGFSSVAKTEFPSRPLADGERISLGDVTLEIRHTPGHTPESISIVVWEHADDEVPYGILTGDTLFIGDVGRPDLLASIGFSKDELARSLYQSLHDKIMPLPDETRVFPGHGAGSACGKSLSTETWSTLGEQRLTNYALRAPDLDTFVELVTEGQPTAPAYFLHDAVLNRQNRELLDETTPPSALTWDEVSAAVDGGAVLVDGRNHEDFARGHLLGSVNVGLEGRYAEFAGSVIKADVDLILVVEPGAEIEARNRLARIGFDRVLGYLSDPVAVMTDHPELTAVASRLTAAGLAERIDTVSGIQLVDVRGAGEVENGSIADAVNIPVAQLPDRTAELDPSRPVVAYCAGGYRSSVAASVLRAAGFVDVSDLIGGYQAWETVGAR